MITDWGTHHVDIAQWAIGMDHTGPLTIKPLRVVFPTPMRNGYAVRDDCYSAPTEFMVTADEWKWAVEGLREVAEYADTCNVTLGVEYLNRFECYLLNTAADGARFCRKVNHPRCKMMYDAFHAHIGEKNIRAAIVELKDCLIHVHISENDRSTPGAGNVRWDENFDALRHVRYDGILMVESVGLALERLLPAAKIWRRMYQSEHQLATDALAFVRREVDKRWTR
jgi:D-psicose/D-tagatose/L-ribulose 3-epimerase